MLLSNNQFLCTPSALRADLCCLLLMPSRCLGDVDAQEIELVWRGGGATKDHSSAMRMNEPVV